MDERPKVLADNPSIKQSEVMKKLGAAWKSASNETKVKYNTLSENEKANEKANENNGEKRVKKKRKKAKKVDGQLKARSAYILFSMDERPKVLADNPSIKQTEVMRKLGAAWKSASNETKVKYNTLSENEKAESRNKVLADGENGKKKVKKVKEDKKTSAKDKASKTKGKSKAKLATTTDGEQSAKKPRNAFFIFCVHERERISKENPGLSGKEIMSKLAESWKNATLEITQHYKVMANIEKESYGSGKVRHKNINID